MRIIWTLCMLLTASALGASVQNSAPINLFSGELEASGVPGLAYAVAEDGRVTTGYYGVSDRDTDTQVDEDTVFLIGSVSKSFTALGIMQLVEAGKLELDAPIAQYLEAFESGTPAGETTIRQLLSHTSGYSTVQGNLWQGDTSVDPDVIERVADEIATLEPDREPGTGWQYSNANYKLLGRLIEVTSGEDFADYIGANVLARAGMTSSFVHDSADIERLATGYTPWFGERRAITENQTGLATAASGGIASTATDMGRYMAMMMNGKTDVVTAQTKALMLQPASDVSPKYGLGWFLNAEKGYVFHSGANVGYESLLTMIPSEQRGAMVMVNAGSGFGFGDTNPVRYGLVKRALDLDEQVPEAGWGAKATFLILAASPLLFLIGAVQAWRKRGAIRAKSGWLRHVSLWLPLVMTGVLAYVLLVVIPGLFGAPLSAIAAFAPDTWVLLVATAVTGLAWALFRLVIAFSGRAQAA